jgi:hypothetical protein
MVKNFLDRVDRKQAEKMQGIEDMEDEIDEDFEENHPFTPALTNNSRRINEMKNMLPIHLRY